MNGRPEYSPNYRPTTSRSSLNIAEKSANNLFASILYGCGTLALSIRHLAWVLRHPIRYPGEVIRGNETFYRNMNLEGQLPFRPLIYPK